MAPPRKYATHEMIRQLQDALAIDPDVTIRGFDALGAERGWIKGQTVRDRFGSWREAVEVAGGECDRTWSQATCSECSEVSYARGRCVAHYLIHMEMHGDEYAGATKYVRVHLAGHRTLLEHRVVMTAMLGRSLLPGETVHHKGKTTDNRPSKLEIRVSAHGEGWTIPEAVAWAREVLARYGSRTS